MPATETIRGYVLNQPGRPAPWGPTENQLFKDIIANLPDNGSLTMDAHRHSSLFNPSGGLRVNVTDASVVIDYTTAADAIRVDNNSIDMFNLTADNMFMIDSANNEVVVNQDQGNFDFRVESNTNANLLCLDADGVTGDGTGNIGVNTIPDGEAIFHIVHDPTATTPTNTSMLVLEHNNTNFLTFLGDDGQATPQGILFDDGVVDAGISYDHFGRILGIQGPGDTNYINLTVTEIVMNDQGLDRIFRVEGNGDADLIRTLPGGATAVDNLVGIGMNPGTFGKLAITSTGDDDNIDATLWVDQSNATGVVPVLLLDQGDASQQFINYVGTSAASAANSISTWTLGNAVQGHFKIEINGVERWMRFYDAPTS